MTTSLPTVLTAAELPYAELQAAALDGDVFPLDRAFCSIAEFDVPWRRAVALAPRVAPASVVARLTAAWVWGATVDAPWEPEILGHGPRIPADASEVVDFGPLRVTAPTRTLVDLARGDLWDAHVALVARRLADEHRIAGDDCRRVMDRTTHLPFRRRAEVRLAALGLPAGRLAAEKSSAPEEKRDGVPSRR